MTLAVNISKELGRSNILGLSNILGISQLEHSLYVILYWKKKLNQAIGLLSKIQHSTSQHLIKTIHHSLFNSYLIHICQVWRQYQSTKFKKKKKKKKKKEKIATLRVIRIIKFLPNSVLVLKEIYI